MKINKTASSMPLRPDKVNDFILSEKDVEEKIKTSLEFGFSNILQRQHGTEGHDKCI